MSNPSRLTALGFGLIGLALAGLLALMTGVIQGIGEVKSFGCTLDRPRTLYLATTIVAALAAAFAILGAFRWPCAAIAAFALGLACAVAWVAADGFGALDCAIGV